MLAAIVANMILQNPLEQVLVATTMNFTADLVAQELYKLKIMQKFVVRTYSQAREDIFNIRIKDLPEYSLIYKMLFESEDALNEYTKQKTDMKHVEPDETSQNRLLASAKFQIEYYFGQTNYPSDLYLQSYEGADGWINMNYINDFPKMKKFRLSVRDIFEMMKKSTVVDVMEEQWDDGEPIYYIRKRDLEI